jgi:hypothetical protein
MAIVIDEILRTFTADDADRAYLDAGPVEPIVKRR